MFPKSATKIGGGGQTQFHNYLFVGFPFMENYISLSYSRG